MADVAARAPDGDYFLQSSSYLNEAHHNKKLQALDLSFSDRFYPNYPPYLLYLDYYSDSHILTSVYQALITGRTIEDNGSYNYAGRIMNFDYLWADNHKKPNLQQVSNMVGMYGSTYNNTGTLIYNSFPKKLKFLDTEDKKSSAREFMSNLYRIKIIFHGVAWALLVFALAFRFGKFFAWICSLGILFFLGAHRHAVLWMHSFIVTGLLPAYVLGLYPLVQKNVAYGRKSFFG